MFQRESLPLTETRVGSENLTDAIYSELAAHPKYASIVISTLTQERSRWALLDLPKYVETEYTLPVYLVVGPVDLESDVYWGAPRLHRGGARQGRQMKLPASCGACSTHRLTATTCRWRFGASL